METRKKKGTVVGFGAEFTRMGDSVSSHYNNSNSTLESHDQTGGLGMGKGYYNIL